MTPKTNKFTFTKNGFLPPKITVKEAMWLSEPLTKGQRTLFLKEGLETKFHMVGRLLHEFRLLSPADPKSLQKSPHGSHRLSEQK